MHSLCSGCRRLRLRLPALLLGISSSGSSAGSSAGSSSSNSLFAQYLACGHEASQARDTISEIAHGRICRGVEEGQRAWQSLTGRRGSHQGRGWTGLARSWCAAGSPCRRGWRRAGQAGRGDGTREKERRRLACSALARARSCARETRESAGLRVVAA